MPQLPSDQFYIFSEETDTESAISEQLAQKLGSAINYLNDLIKNQEIFTSSTSYVVQEGVLKIYALIWGGGGGGAGGNSGGTIAGGGGAGAVPQLYTLRVTPLDTWNVVIGAGGNNGGVNSDGGNGGTSTFRHSITNVGLTAYGGKGGRIVGISNEFSGGNGLNYDGNIEPVTQANTSFDRWTMFDHFTFGGTGASANSTTGQPGQSSPYALGGNGGSGSDCGGGGGAGFGAGGNGSSTTSGTATSAASNSGAGGGGGGGAKAGGNGGSGGLIIFY